MIETFERLTAGRDLFRQSQFLLGQLFNPLFERMGDQLSLGLNDPVEQHFNLAFGILELRAQGLHAAGAVLAAHIPSAFERSDRKVEEVCGGREHFEQSFKLPFDLRALDRLDEPACRLQQARMRTTTAVAHERQLGWPLSLARTAYRRMSRLLLNPDEVCLRQISNRGLKLLVFQNEDIGRRLIVLKHFEDEELDYCLGSISTGELCIDVGGNIGYYAVHLARAVGASGRVLCIEPLHRNFLVIALSAELNGLHNIDVVEAAAVDVAGPVGMHLPDTDSAYAHVQRENAAEGAGALKVAGVTIDSLLAGNDQPVAFMKVDVEGAEELAVRGACDLLHDVKRKPRLIMAELVPAYLSRFGSTMETVLAFFADAGYQPYRLNNNRLVAFTQADWGQSCNVFFTPNSKA